MNLVSASVGSGCMLVSGRTNVGPAHAAKALSASSKRTDARPGKCDTTAADEEMAPDRGTAPTWKRALDIAIVLVALPAGAFVFLLLSIYIKFVSRGPVFFRQERMGRGGKPFRLLKFRTMHVDNNGGIHQNHLTNLMSSNQPMEKLDAVDPRIIPLGRLLRSSGLDELPQLINVLRGEMSVVGPRPCTRYEYEQYEPWHKERLLALPGLTGLWQVSGKNKTTFNEMVRLDVRYAKNLSLGMDLKIIVRTFPTLLGLVSEHLEAWRQQKAIARGSRQAQAEAT